VVGHNLNDAQWQHLYEVALKRAKNLLRGDAEAEDIAQSAMLGLLQTDPWPDNPEAWLMVTVNRRKQDLDAARDGLQQALQPQRVYNAEGQGQEALADEILVRQAISPFLHTSHQVAVNEFLKKAMAVLTQSEAELLVGAARGISRAALAQEYGYASAATVTQTISRARKKLKAIQEERREADRIF